MDTLQPRNLLWHQGDLLAACLHTHMCRLPRAGRCTNSQHQAQVRVLYPVLTATAPAGLLPTSRLGTGCSGHKRRKSQTSIEHNPSRQPQCAAPLVAKCCARDVQRRQGSSRCQIPVKHEDECVACMHTRHARQSHTITLDHTICVTIEGLGRQSAGKAMCLATTTPMRLQLHCGCWQ